MEFLTLEQLRECVVEIRAAFNALMENQTLAVRKDARQWRFFRSCLERTLAALPGTWSADRVHWPSVTGAALAAIPGRWPMHPPQQLAQFKFEVEDKLRRFYLRHSGPIDFVFSLVHRRDAVRDRLIVDPRYPHTAGYYLLVRDRRDEAEGAYLSSVQTRAYLEKVVACCIDAEFDAYQALPAVDEAQLLRWIRRDSGAHLDLVDALAQLKRLGWVLTNPSNPSTRRLLAIDVKEVRGNEAVVRTTEYWYLRWWSTIEQRYRYPFRETNRHSYVLANTPDGWLVDENIRPVPRSSTPYRHQI